MADGAVGRPSSYTDEIAQEICDRLMDGETLVAICQNDGMPNRSTVVRWMNTDPDFASRCARAREEQADYMDHKILSVADASTPETAQADRVKIAAYQWRASKLAPRRYGDKLDLTHANPDGSAIAPPVIHVAFTKANGSGT